MAEGIITKQDLITVDALQFGQEYANNVQMAIDSNNLLKESAKQMFDVYGKLKKATSEDDFKNAKNEEALAIQKATNAIKAREAALISAEKIKKQAIATQKESLDLDVKIAKSKKEIAALEIQEEKLNQQKIKSAKEEASLQQQLQKIEIEKARLTSEKIKNSGLVLRNLQEEEKLTKQKLSVIQQENKVVAQQSAEVSKQLNVWKEQDQLEKSLISTKKKNALATESTNRALIKERLALADTNKEIKASLTTMGGLVSARDKARKSVQEYQAKLALGKRLSNDEQKELAQSTVAFNKYDAAVRSIKESTNQFQENVGNYPKQFQAVASGIKQLLPILGIAAGIRVAFGVIRDSFNDIVEFDRQLIAVGKTTNITGEDLKNFGREVVALGDQMDGVSVIGLLKTSEIAGTLGVTGTANILKFATAVEQLKLTSDIISDEQVQNFAQFIEVSQDSFENADRLASVMTVLGNNTATTEAKILSNATEIQKGVSIYNSSAQGVLGLGAATSALGNEADTSRTAIQKTFAVIDKAIFSGKGLKDVLELTGLTQKELSKQFKEDATGVFVKFVGGLSKAKDEGKNLNKVLTDVGIVETRATTVIGSLAANYDTLTNSVNLATIEYEENLALQKEVGAATESVSSIISDIKDRWAAYVLSTSDANGVTEKAASLLKFLRDNLTEIIQGFIKYGSVLLTYIGVLKLVSFATSAYTALKTAAAAAELNFAIKTGIGRAAVLAQAEAVKAATVAQTGLNVALIATPWGIILAFLAAAVIAYQVFNDSLSENEKIQKRINDNIKNTQNLLKESAENNTKFYNDSIKQIEDEFELKRASQGSSLELDKEEIESKKKLLNAYRDSNGEQIKANRDLIESTKTTSESKLKTLEDEALRLREIADRNSFYGNDLAVEKAKKDIEDFIVNNENKINNLEETNKSLLEENRKFNDDISNLDKASRLKNAEEEKAAAEESKKEREKRLKEAEALKKLLESDKYNLDKTILQQSIDAEKLKLDNTKLTAGQRLSANLDYYIESVKLLDFEKAHAISNAKGRKDELERIELEYNDDIAKLQRERSKTSEAILQDSFEKTKKRIDEKKKLEEAGLDQDISKLQSQLQEQLAVEGISTSERFRLIKKYEDDVLKLKQESAKKQLQVQIDALEQELKINQALDPEQRLALEQILADAKIALNNEVTENAIANAQKIAETELKFQELKRNVIANASQSIADSLGLDAQNIQGLFDSFLIKAETTGDAIIDKYNKVAQTISQIGTVTAVTGDIFQSIFDANISKIDDAIDANDEYYERRIQLAEGDKEQQDLLREEQEAKRVQLEEKKKQEQIKAAKFGKAFAIFNIGITTAQAAIAALAPPPVGLGPILGIPLAATAIALGLLQAGAVLAKPIPKYELGTDFHPGGLAEVAEKRPEVIHEPNKKPYIQHDRAVLKLAKGTKVYSSVDEFESLKRAAILTGFQAQKHQLNSYETEMAFDFYNDGIVKELQMTRQAIKDNRTNVKVQQSKPIDFNHELFRFKNTNFS